MTNKTAQVWSREADRVRLVAEAKANPAIAETVMWTLTMMNYGHCRDPYDKSAPWRGQWK